MSMRNYLDETDVVNSIRLQLRHRSNANKVWIIVEGETDQKLFSKLINGEQVKFEISHGGLQSLLEAVSELLEETNRILGIRDADFLHLEGKEETAENIFLTDFHDAEMMIISCDDAYHQVFAEYFSKEKQPQLFREAILKSIAFIGGLRWINDNNSNSLEFNFKGLGFGNFYDGKTTYLNEEICLNEVMTRSPNKKKTVSRNDVILKIQNISDFLNLCNGHDFLKAFASCVSSRSRSTRSKKGVNHEDIGKAFRIAYRFEDFQKTNLYQKLKEWGNIQSRNLFKTASM